MSMFGDPIVRESEESYLPEVDSSDLKRKKLFKAITLINEKRPVDIDDVVDSDESHYDSFMVLRALSLTQDTVLSASMMNERPILHRDQQVAFLLNNIRQRRRFTGKWPKASNDKTIELIARYYGMSRREAAPLVKLHTDTELATMSSVVGKDHTCSRFR